MVTEMGPRGKHLGCQVGGKEPFKGNSLLASSSREPLTPHGKSGEGTWRRLEWEQRRETRNAHCPVVDNGLEQRERWL